MPPRRPDIYNAIAVMTPSNFELRGDGLAVPLEFRPDAACMLRIILAQTTEFRKEVVTQDPNFRATCEGTFPPHRFVGVFSRVRFTLDALGSALIQTVYKQGTRNIYQRNPDYTIIDELDLLGPR